MPGGLERAFNDFKKDHKNFPKNRDVQSAIDDLDKSLESLAKALADASRKAEKVQTDLASLRKAGAEAVAEAKKQNNNALIAAWDEVGGKLDTKSEKIEKLLGNVAAVENEASRAQLA